MNKSSNLVVKLLILLLFFACAYTYADTPPTPASATSAQQNISDSWITTKIKSQLATTRGVDASSINVSTENKVVTLSGVCSTLKCAMKTIKIAESTQGVSSVNFDDLSIKDSSTSTQDAYITTKVKWVLKTNGVPDVGEVIHVSTRAGTVFLKGHVANQQAKDNAGQLAASVKGVTHVKNDLMISGQG